METRLCSLIRTILLEILCAAVFWQSNREKRYRFPSAYNKYQNQTAQQIKLELIIHFIPIHMCMRKQIRRCRKRRLNRILLLADRKVIPALNCIN